MFRIGIIGTGVVGSAVALVLNSKGHIISGVCSENGLSSADLAEKVNARCFSEPEDLPGQADIIFVTTPDRVIGKIAERLSKTRSVTRDHIFFHMSGALPASVLQPLQLLGASVGSIHPLQSFAGINQAVNHLSGTFFAVQGDPKAVDKSLEIVKEIGGNPYLIDEKNKALYHLGACAASNYIVSLVHYAVSIFKKIGMEDKQALEALFPLIMGTMDNIQNMGPVKSLTGPVARGDFDTIKKHLTALSSLGPEFAGVYKTLGEYTCQVALEKQSIDINKAKLLTEIFNKEADVDAV